jgi:predicted amidophosphoribosyltransferase
VWISLLVPSRCCACGSPGGALCSRCFDGLERIGPVCCGRCGAPTVVAVERCRECAGRRLAFARARGAVAYDACAKALVHAWKERGVHRLAAVAAELVVAAVERPQVDAVAALPADPIRALRRGRHPADQLARLLAVAWELPLDRTLLRVGGGTRQRGLAVAERRANVRGAFVARGTPLHTLLLVDDVYTTGATTDAAARTLRRAGARRVEVVTLARVRRLA